MKEKRQLITIPLVVAMLSFIGGAISYFFIKDQIPIHWDMNWEVDGTVPKEMVFLISALPLALYLFLGTKKNAITTAKGNRISVIACTYLLVFVQWLSIATALKTKINIKLVIPCVIGAFLIISGNFMPTISKNYYIGLRTPWSVRSNLSWKKTNRIGGYLMSIIGVVLIICGIVQKSFLYNATIIAFLVILIICMFISYHYWKIDPDRRSKK